MARHYTNTTARTGGRRKSTNAQFQSDVETRLYGNNNSKSTNARVAIASARNVPQQIVNEVNKRGGRNSLRTSPNGTQTKHSARYRELRASFGMTTG